MNEIKAVIIIGVVVSLFFFGFGFSVGRQSGIKEFKNFTVNRGLAEWKVDEEGHLYWSSKYQ